MNVVVVESPAKAKTINKYMGQDYEVLASYGHIRDLPAKDGSVLPDEDFSMSWEVDERAEKRIRAIAQALKSSDRLVLATDPDREGEAISWHIVEELKRRKALGSHEVQRVVFNEITKSAVQDAFQHPRELNNELVEAYLARRALDYLVGFSLSPVLWRKLPGSRSAGRVQSVSLRLICDREAEIEVFKPREYWTIECLLENKTGNAFSAGLTHIDGRKLEKFDLPNADSAEAAASRLRTATSFEIASIERKRTKRNPYPPFTTSTLQQEASRKLGLGTSRTMRIAQKLYEGVDLGGETVGLITYMRTDSVQLSNEAIVAARRTIGDNYGDGYLPSSPRIYKTKAKNAQEAHEAIRPTDPGRRPQDVARVLNADELKLYDLIWKRTIASQMASAELDQVAAEIAVNGNALTLRATGSTLAFDGFLRLYQEGRDDNDAQNGDKEGRDRRLPALAEGESATRRDVLPDQHFTQPPPRYSEASLVKKMEELGIGRPSTYASILQVLQDRDYVRLEQRRFIPEDRGRLVTAFLASYFERYIEFNFTADLEEQLDDISGGRLDWKKVLADFWYPFHTAIENTSKLSISDVINAVDEALGPHFFPQDEENPERDPRGCPSCNNGRLGVRLGRTGGFIGCSNYPDCRHTRPLTTPGNGEGEDDFNGPQLLGTDTQTGLDVTLRKGPYGIYVQLGEPEGKSKPKRASLPKGMAASEVDLARALALLALPREVGAHPENGEAISAGIGRYGPYVKHGAVYRSLEAGDDVLTIGLNRAVALLADAPARSATASRQLGEHPEDGKVVSQGKGRFGPYVRHGKLYASIPKDIEPENVTLEEAVKLLRAQAEKKQTKGPGKAKGAAKKKAPAKKTASKKAAKKSTAKAKPAKSSRPPAAAAEGSS